MNQVSKIVNYIVYAMMIVAVVFEGLILYHGDDSFAGNDSLQSSVLGPFFLLSYSSAIIPTALVIVFPIYFIITNPKGAKTALFGVLGVVVLFGLAYVLADSEILPTFPKGTTEGQVKMVNTGLITFYIVLFIAVGSIVYSEVSRIFK